MNSIYLLDLASHQAGWLSARQTVIAGNVANVDTPGYRAGDVEPFTETLETTRLAMAVTAPGHIPTGTMQPGDVPMAVQKGWEVKASGNSVTLEAELLKSGQVGRSYSLNTAIVKSFHNMLMMSAKS